MAKFVQLLRPIWFREPGIAFKEGHFMVSRLLRSFGGISTPVVRRVRILGLLAVLGFLAAASLPAQDKPQSTNGPKRVVPSSPGSVPAPSGSTPERAPQPSQPAPVQLVDQEILSSMVLANPMARRFQFKIAPNTPLKDLLPVPPTAKNPATPLIAKDLTQVPEIEFQMPLEKKQPSEEALKQTAHTMAKINHLNDKKADGFLEALRRERLDLSGMPFAMGEACRTKGERSKRFAFEVALVRAEL